MEERAPRTVLIAVMLAMLLPAACAGQYRGPRTLASLGSFGVIAGSVTWATGEALKGGSHDAASRPVINAGFISVAVGLAAIVAAGGWMAATVACTADPDCDEEWQCREIPAPPGGIPYKQCMPR